MRSLLVIACVFGSLSHASADRPELSTGAFELSSTDLEHVEKDERGREIFREIQHFTPDGYLTSRTTWVHTYRDGRPVQITRRTERPDGVLTGQLVEARKYVRSRLDRIIREWTDGDGLLTRHEESIYTEDKKAKTRLITTTVRNGIRALIETRYTILTNVRNAFYSSDTSVFNADGIQTSRHLTEWRGNTIERWTFDEQDEVTRYESESLQKDSKGRTVVSNTDIFSGGRIRIGARDRRMTYDGPQGAISLSVTTWFDQNEQALQRETVRHIHERGSVVRRVRWERWSDDSP